jgi:hypothetical protein
VAARVNANQISMLMGGSISVAGDNIKALQDAVLRPIQAAP